MNHATLTIGDATSVAQRFGTNSLNPLVVRPEKLKDVLCYNNTGGTLFMQVHEIGNTQITVSSAGTAGANQAYNLQTTLKNGQPWWLSADTNFSIQAIAGAVAPSVAITWEILSGVTPIYFTTTQGDSFTGGTGFTFPWFGSWSTSTGAAPAPAVSSPVAVAPPDGAVPRFSFPVATLLGGTLGQECDLSGIYCCWSSTQATKTIAGASGSITIVLKQ